MLWVNNGDFGNTNNSKDPIIALDQANVHKFAAMVPVVDLEFLRGIRVNHIYEIKTPPAHSEMSWGYTSDLVDFSVLGR